MRCEQLSCTRGQSSHPILSGDANAAPVTLSHLDGGGSLPEVELVQSLVFLRCPSLRHSSHVASANQVHKRKWLSQPEREIRILWLASMPHVSAQSFRYAQLLTISVWRTPSKGHP